MRWSVLCIKGCLYCIPIFIKEFNGKCFAVTEYIDNGSISPCFDPNEKELPEEITRRFSKRIEDVLPLENHCLLVFFRDGVVKKCDLQKHFEKTKTFQVLLKKPDYFQYVQIQTGGYGVAWDVNMTVSDAMLYRIGKSVPLTMEDFRNFAAHRIINASEAAEILGCSRQNIIDLTKRGKLHPIKTSEKSTLYLKSEVLKRNWQ